MAVQGFKGSRAIESEEAEYKGLVRGLLLGCALPSVMLCVFLWNTGVSTNIVSKDVGAPIEVMERMKAVEGRTQTLEVFFERTGPSCGTRRILLTEGKSTIPWRSSAYELFSIKRSRRARRCRGTSARLGTRKGCPKVRQPRSRQRLLYLRMSLLMCRLPYQLQEVRGCLTPQHRARASRPVPCARLPPARSC